MSERSELIGEGFNVFDTDEKVEGRAKNVTKPEDIIKLVETGEDFTKLILISPGGTTTFLALPISKGVRGIITFAGAPQSHLGIITREFEIPCIMTLKLKEGEGIPEDESNLIMDCSDSKIGKVYIKRR